MTSPLTCASTTDQRDLIAVADSRESHLADEFTGDERVRQIIELLKDDTAKKRQTKLPKDP